MAAPAKTPQLADEYLASDNTFLQPFTRPCLHAEDTRAEGVSLGTLEGKLFTIRREDINREQFQPRYFFAPVNTDSFPAASVENDLMRLSDTLHFSEFRAASMVRHVATDVEKIASQEALWGATLGTFGDLVDDCLSVISTARATDLERVDRRAGTLSIVLSRLQARLNVVSGEFDQLRRTHLLQTGYVHSTLVHAVSMSSLQSAEGRSILGAVADSFPIHQLGPELQSMESRTQRLVEGFERIQGLLRSVLEETTRLSSERFTRWTRRITALVAALALTIALPGFVPNAQLTSQHYPGWLRNLLTLHSIEVGSQVLVVATIAVSVLMFLLYVGARLQVFSPSEDSFVSDARLFNHLVDRAEELCDAAFSLGPDHGAWKRIEDLDATASTPIARMWRDARIARADGFSWTSWVSRPLRRGSGPQHIDRWIGDADRLEKRILMFDLAPKSIVLPRSLCVYRCMSSKLLSRSMISDWDFEFSLMRAGFAREEVEALDRWLSSDENRPLIAEMTVADFWRALISHGVTADKHHRTPDKWKGKITDNV
jgi:hypothetical protein